MAALTGLDASTTLRLQHSLSERGYVVRDDAAKHYMAGLRALSPLSLFHPLTLFRRDAEQVPRSLQQNTVKTSALVLFLGMERLVVDFIRGRLPLSPYYDTWLKSHCVVLHREKFCWHGFPTRSESSCWDLVPTRHTLRRR